MLPETFPVRLLTEGSHASPSKGLCLLEAAAFRAKRPHSDHDETVCEVLTHFGRMLNDAPWSSDAARTEALADLIDLLPGTAASDEVQHRRAAFFADRALRVYAPAALMIAVCALEDAGLDASELREAGLDLCNAPESSDADNANAAAASRATASAANTASRAAASAANTASRAANAVLAASNAVLAAARAYAAHAASNAAHAAGNAALAAARASSAALAAAARAYAASNDTLLRIAADDLRDAIAIT